jgi:small subunit ribosomal protein S17
MKTRGIKRQLTGTVVSDKMDKTAVVQVERLVKHPVYKKFVRRSNKFAAHDEENKCKTGDKVVITESRPISKLKRWRITDIIERAV